jgi:hypothetical protein
MNVLAEDFHELLDLLEAADAPLKVASEPGAGKSKMVEAWALTKNDAGEPFGLFVLDMSKANLADLQGYLMPETVDDVDADGRPVKVMAGKYTYPHFLYDWFTGKPAYQFKRGAIVFEEWGQGDPEVKRASASIINDRRLGQHRFDNFHVILLSNRAADRSGVTKEYDFLINRWVEVELTATLNGFLVAADKLGMTPMTMAFAARNEALLFQGAVPKAQGPWLTQRSLHKLDSIIKAAFARGMALDHPLVLTAASGAVGDGAAHSYMAFVKARSKIPTVSAIVAHPDTTPVPEELDVAMFLVFDLASKTKRDNLKPIVSYIKRMPSDFAVTYFHAVTRRDKSLVSTTEFSQFALDNLSLLTAVAGRK